MDFWTAIVLIVVFCVGFETIQEWIRSKNKRSAKDLANRIDALEQQAQNDLEERVANLEKILTDPKTKLREKIDEL